jgi:hypothetical protein
MPGNGGDDVDAQSLARMFDAWNQHDADAIVEELAEDATYADMELGESNTGRDAIRRYIARLDQEFSSDCAMELGFMVATDAGYAVE